MDIDAPPPLMRQRAMDGFIYINNGNENIPHGYVNEENGVQKVFYQGGEYPIVTDQNGERIIVNNEALHIIRFGGRLKRKRTKRKKSKRKLSRR